MEKIAIFIAALLQLFGVSIYFEQPDNQCAIVPSTASWLFLLATIIFLWDVRIYPRRFMHMDRPWKVLIESIACTVVVEMSTIVIWCNIERAIYTITRRFFIMLSRNVCSTTTLEYYVQGLVTSALSGGILWFILEATDTIYYTKCLLHSISQEWGQVWPAVVGVCGLSSTRRRQVFKACRTAMNPRRRRYRTEAEELDEE